MPLEKFDPSEYKPLPYDAWENKCPCALRVMIIEALGEEFVPIACGCLGVQPDWKLSGYSLSAYYSDYKRYLGETLSDSDRAKLDDYQARVKPK